MKGFFTCILLLLFKILLLLVEELLEKGLLLDDINGFIILLLFDLNGFIICLSLIELLELLMV